MEIYQIRRAILKLPLLVFAATTVIIASCIHDEDDSDSPAGAAAVVNPNINLNAGATGMNIPLSAANMTQIVKTYNFDLDDVGGPLGTVTMDLTAHLDKITLTLPVVTGPDSSKKAILAAAAIPLKLLIKPAHATAHTAQMFIRTDRAEAVDTVCTTGEAYGPIDIVLDAASQPMSVTPASLTATQPTMDVINSGSYVVCVLIFSPIDATADLAQIDFEAENCTDPPANISGTWSGTFMCEPDNTVEAISLTIVQDMLDPSVATYTDGSGASYQGRVCGNRFSFTGGLAGDFTESGTFVLIDATSATKTSTYKEVPPSTFSGDCVDNLTFAG